MATEIPNETPTSAIIKNDIPRDLFVGEHAEYYRRKLRRESPVTVVSTSYETAYLAVRGEKAPYLGEQARYYIINDLKEDGYDIRIATPEEIEQLRNH